MLKAPRLRRRILRLLFSLAPVIFAAGAFTWLYLYIQGSTERLAIIENNLYLLDEERRSARSVELIFDVKKEEIFRLGKFFIPGDKPVEFIENLEKIARGTANQISLEVVTEKPVGGALSFRIAVEGYKESAIRYLSLIELLPHELSIEEFSFQKLGAIAEPEKVRLVLLIRVKTL